MKKAKEKTKNKSNNFFSADSEFKQKLVKFFDKFKTILCDAIYPDNLRCIVCEKEIPAGSKYCMCEECFKTFPFNNGRICVRCGAPINNEALYCLECQNYTRGFDFARSSLNYTGDAKRLVLGLKFKNNRWIAKYFAQMLYDTYMENALDAEIVIPVPISYKREKQRGFNQSYLLAKPLAEKLGLPLHKDIIIKTKDNKQQAKLGLSERRKNVVGAYEIARREFVKGKKVLLVDDILTTGSTMSEVARRLKIAGATAVYGLAVASPEYIVPCENNEDITDFELISK